MIHFMRSAAAICGAALAIVLTSFVADAMDPGAQKPAATETPEAAKKPASIEGLWRAEARLVDDPKDKPPTFIYFKIKDGLVWPAPTNVRAGASRLLSFPVKYELGGAVKGDSIEISTRAEMTLPLTPEAKKQIPSGYDVQAALDEKTGFTLNGKISGLDSGKRRDLAISGDGVVRTFKGKIGGCLPALLGIDYDPEQYPCEFITQPVSWNAVKLWDAEEVDVILGIIELDVLDKRGFEVTARRPYNKNTRTSSIDAIKRDVPANGARAEGTVSVVVSSDPSSLIYSERYLLGLKDTQSKPKNFKGCERDIQEIEPTGSDQSSAFVYKQCLDFKGKEDKPRAAAKGLIWVENVIINMEWLFTSDKKGKELPNGYPPESERLRNEAAAKWIEVAKALAAKIEQGVLPEARRMVRRANLPDTEISDASPAGAEEKAAAEEAEAAAKARRDAAKERRDLAKKWRESGQRAEIIGVEGDVQVMPGGDVSKSFDLQPGTSLNMTDRIFTGLESTVTLKFPDGSTITVQELTDMEVEEFTDVGQVIKTQIWLRGGEVAAQVDHGADQASDFTVRTPTPAIAGVRGTRFSVRYAERPRRQTLVRAEEGEVTVTPGNTELKPVVVGAGGEARVTPEKITTSGPVRPLKEVLAAEQDAGGQAASGETVRQAENAPQVSEPQPTEPASPSAPESAATGESENVQTQAPSVGPIEPESPAPPAESAASKEPAPSADRESAGTGESAPAEEAASPAPGTAEAPPSGTTAAPSGSGKDSAAELAFWNSIQDSTNPREFELFLEQFPDSAFANLARFRLERLAAGAQADGGNSMEPASQVPSGPAPIVECDWLAAEPLNPQAVVAGPADDMVDPARAIAACEEAVTLYPQEMRFWRQLSRAHRLAGTPKPLVPRLEAASRDGNVAAMTMLGILLAEGPEDLRDEAEAVRLLRQAADEGDTLAMVQLGFASAEGKFGLAKDQDEAMRLLRAAAETDDEMGAVNLAGVYEYGWGGLPKDTSEALRVYRKAAESGNALAMNKLAFKYETGALGLAKDESEAFRWYLKAAERGVREAMLKVGSRYDHGNGVAEDDIESVSWYRKAADLGDHAAMFYLGLAYQYGKGVPEDMVEAKSWYQKAAEHGDDNAKKTLDKLSAVESATPPDEAKPAGESKPEEKAAAVEPAASEPGPQGEPRIVKAKDLRSLVGNFTTLVWSLDFSPDGSMLASGTHKHGVRLWDMAKGTVSASYEGQKELIDDIAVSPDGAVVASASDDGTVALLDAKTGKLKHTLKGHDDKVNAIAFSPDGTRVASGGNDKTIRLWNVKTGDKVRVLEAKSIIRSLSFSPNGARLASAGTERHVTLWDVRSGKKLSSFADHHPAYVDEMTFAPDWKRVATADDNVLKVWDVDSGKLLRSLEHGGKDINAVAFSPDGALVASANANAVKLWDAASGALRLVIEHPSHVVTSVAFSPDGSRLAIGGGDIKLFDLKDDAAPAEKAADVSSAKAAATKPGASGYEKYAGHAIPSHNIRTLTDTSVDACAEACSGDAACLSFDYELDSRKCHLQDTARGRTKARGYDHYVKPNTDSAAPASD